MSGVKIEWQDMVPKSKLDEALTELRLLISYCCSGKRYEVKNPYLVPEIRRAIRWLYGEEFPPEDEVKEEEKMALPGETTGLKEYFRCTECGELLPLLVLSSPAGYYIGRKCPNCGPYSRETVYFQNREMAQYVLDNPSLLTNTNLLRGGSYGR